MGQMIGTILRLAVVLALGLAAMLGPAGHTGTHAATHGMHHHFDHSPHPVQADPAATDPAPAQTGHAHQHAMDHDHAAPVILPASAALPAPDLGDTWATPIPPATGIPTGGLRRPPRALI